MFHSSDYQQDLRRRALAALHANVLPCAPPLRSRGGRGAGELCPVCGHCIEPAELELELEFAAVGDAARQVHMHMPCFMEWEIAMKLARPP
jgi:hypothetical protein